MNTPSFKRAGQRLLLGSLLGLLLGLLLWLAPSSIPAVAHKGEAHAEPATAVTAANRAGAERPTRLPDGSLQVPKSVQHLLGLRTVAWTSADTVAHESLLAEVEAQASASLAVIASEPGRLEAAEGGWPQPGQTVNSGQVLAWLHPLISAREIARRRTRKGDLEQKLIIAKINLDRLALQAVGNDVTRVAQGNVRYEQTVAEYEAVKRQLALITDSLRERLPVRAAATGRIAGIAAGIGDVVSVGLPLFRLVDASHLRLSAVSTDAGLGARLQSATVSGAASARLRFIGQEPLVDRPGWRLLFDITSEAAGLSPGQLVEIDASTRPAQAVWPEGACAPEHGAMGVVWIHREAERFEPLQVSCSGSNTQAVLALADGARIVTQGGSYLLQYR